MRSENAQPAQPAARKRPEASGKRRGGPGSAGRTSHAPTAASCGAPRARGTASRCPPARRSGPAGRSRSRSGPSAPPAHSSPAHPSHTCARGAPRGGPVSSYSKHVAKLSGTWWRVGPWRLHAVHSRYEQAASRRPVLRCGDARVLVPAISTCAATCRADAQQERTGRGQALADASEGAHSEV